MKQTTLLKECCQDEVNERLMNKKWFEPYTSLNLPIYIVDNTLEFDRKSAEKIYVSKVNNGWDVVVLDKYLIDIVQNILDKWNIKEFNCWNLYKKHHYKINKDNLWELYY